MKRKDSGSLPAFILLAIAIVLAVYLMISVNNHQSPQATDETIPQPLRQPQEVEITNSPTATKVTPEPQPQPAPPPPPYNFS